MILIKSWVDSTINCLGRYFCNILLRDLATVYVDDPIFDMIGRSGGFVTFLCILAVPYI
jgi:hypothetical protein